MLEYCARPDGLSISDCLKDPAVPVFRYIQHSRDACFDYLSSSFASFAHFGTHLPTQSECLALKLPSVVKFEWPSAVKAVIKHLSKVVAVCTQSGVL